ncbi:helix-turn-helix transcriptional regulator [Streptomonospora arabica]|uniref:Helix-turn-helix transcriptional regulator n=1 Tax=Streptomonospora arabica TaxID=412417 RepID=A0ABV9SNU8_9ACTN
MVDKVRPQWVRFGNELRRLRVQAGLSQGDLGARIQVSHALISAFERGTRQPRDDYVIKLDNALETSGSLVRLWETSSRSSGIPSEFSAIDQLERAAVEIRAYSPMVVPGLLQTKEYAHRILRDGDRVATEGEIEERTDTRVARQDVLRSDAPPLLVYILDEAVLRRRTGGHETMGRQIERLVEVSHGSRAIIQVIPLRAECHPGLSEEFTLLAMPDGTEVLYMETREAGGPVENADVRRNYVRHFGDLRGAALPEAESLQLIKEAGRECR